MPTKAVNDVIVIGAGPYGLSMSYYLKKAGIAHRVLERGQIANSWRTQRWNSFMMNTSNYTTNMPETPYTGNEPEGFRTLAEFIAHIENFVTTNELRVETGVPVTGLFPSDLPDSYVIEIPDETLIARNVVIATSCQNRPIVPEIAPHIPQNLFQIHTESYRNPRSLPAGPVLIVGSGSSGCQIAEDLIEAGRTVYLSTCKMPRAPRQYRGHDFGYWNHESGYNYTKVEDLPDQSVRLRPPRMSLQSGVRGGRAISLQRLSAQGAVLLGRLKGFEAGHLVFEDDLEANIQFADQAYTSITQRIDAFIKPSNIHAPLPVPTWEETATPAILAPAILSLDPVAAGISSVVWCTGFGGDFSWIRLPVFDNVGWPKHVDGITDLPGIYFIGLHWLSRRSSNTVMGVSQDAQLLAACIADRCLHPFP
jgi:putative flavoprotein involved in K+ transport